MGNVTEKKIVHGAFYTVCSLGERIKVKDLETNDEFEVTSSDMKKFRYGYAITYCAVQSRTLRQHVRLWDTAHARFTSKLLANLRKLIKKIKIIQIY